MPENPSDERLHPSVGESVQTPAVRPCPVCGTPLDGATQVGGPGAQPEPGDVSACIYCGVPLVFTADAFRVMPAAETRALEASNFNFRQMMRAVRERKEGASDA